MIFLFANNAETVLAQDVLFTATSIVVATGTGALFPAPAARQVLALTLSSALNPTVTEVVYCTAISGDTLTITRAQEGTVARNWYVADFVENLLTAGTAQNFAQVTSGSTSQRPIPTQVGQPYFDTTLGYSISAKQITPSVIWVNWQGASV